MYRDHTKVVKIGDRVIGGGNPILIQSMTNTKTEDVEATVAQILELEQAGCDIIRCAVPTMEAAEAISAIKVLMHEYLDIKNQIKENFEESNVDEGLRYMISVSDIKRNISNVTFNNVVIQNYVKTNEYATITYGVSIGYTLGNNEKMQERYKVEYTLKLRDDNMEKDILILRISALIKMPIETNLFFYKLIFNI